MKKKFEEVENKIKKLITSHQELKSEIAFLKKDKLKLEKMLEEEKARLMRMDEGYKQLNEVERTKNSEKIKAMKMKINSLVGEIDKSVELITKK